LFREKISRQNINTPKSKFFTLAKNMQSYFDANFYKLEKEIEINISLPLTRTKINKFYISVDFNNQGFFN
jgi:hypothetical protein